MSEDSQIVVPASFVALFVEPGRIKPSASQAEIAARYEFCEDLAVVLVDQAKTLQWQLGIADSDVLSRVHEGLLSPASGVSAPEAQWVTRRLAELLACG
ncbi:ATPase with chaperone activity [Piscinibacter sp. XHJ-5]|uniref:ATPase with chaperone activity n=1 Tax=Piscinibacter sp. XHJ-5 TaxID=3037797 RepID=UPI00245288F6|nr:ATPase with chaperone activity [Piscinibacter sp. XHJ-5]